MKFQFFFLLISLLFTSCQSHRGYTPEEVELVSIHLVGKDGMTEAIANPDRLKNFESIDFLSHQPYQKVLRVYSRDEIGNITAYITTYHPNGQVKQYLEVQNNRAFGAYREWFPNGTIKVEATVIEGIADVGTAAEKSWLFDGESKAFDECGTLLATIPYCRGSLEGEALYYHPNGTLWKKIPYSQNVISGEASTFLESGDLLEKAMFDNGVKSGSSIRYWTGGDNPTVAAEESYEGGYLRSGVYYDKTGKEVARVDAGEGIKAIFGKEGISELQDYKGGLPEGKVQVFTRSGDLLKTYITKNGLKHGEEIIYGISRSNQAKQKLLVPWYLGKVQGVSKSWYDNGVMESQRELSENMLNGVSTAWYRTSEIMMIEEYERGKLVKGDYYKKGTRVPVSQVIQGTGTVTLFDPEGTYLRKINYLNGKPEE